MTDTTTQVAMSAAEQGGIMDKVKSFLPDTSKYYLEPLDPSSDIAPADRVTLVWRSARPWREFFDFTNFNLPPPDQWPARISHNTQTFFYNYVLLTVLHLLFFAIGHLGSVVTLVCYAGVMYWLFVMNEGSIVVTDSFEISRNIKIAIAAFLGFLALFVGGVLTLVFSLAIFLLIFVGIHASIMEISQDLSETNPIPPTV